MTKFFIILDLVLSVVCGLRHEFKRAASDIQMVNETIVVSGSDTLVVDSVNYSPVDSI